MFEEDLFIKSEDISTKQREEQDVQYMFMASHVMFLNNSEYLFVIRTVKVHLSSKF